MPKRKKEVKQPDSSEKVKESEQEESKKSGEIRIQETEEEHVLGSNFSGDPDEFKDEIKKDSDKGDVASKFLIPLITFLLIAGLSITVTWYWARPENTTPNTEEKIQTPPKVDEKKPTATPTPASKPEKKETTYTVKEGDTLSSIANANGMTSTELATYNGVTDVNSLHIGQVLKIPTK